MFTTAGVTRSSTGASVGTPSRRGSCACAPAMNASRNSAASGRIMAASLGGFMPDTKRSISRAEAEALIDKRVSAAIREVVWVMVVVTPELAKLAAGTPEDHARFAAALDGVAQSQKE